MNVSLDLWVASGLALVVVVALCVFSRRFILQQLATTTQRKRYWYHADLFHCLCSAVGLAALVTNLISINYVQFHQRRLAGSLQEDRIQLLWSAHFGISESQKKLNTPGTTPEEQRQATAALSWFERVRSKFWNPSDTSQSGEAAAQAAKLKEYLLELNQDREAFTLIPGAALARTSVISSLQRLIEEREQQAQLRDFPEVLKQSTLNWGVTLLAFVLTPLGLGTRFAKVEAEARGWTKDPEPGVVATP